MDALSKFHAGMVVLYGVRLGTFIWQRQHQPSFSDKAKATDDKLKDMPLKKKLGMWFGVSVLYSLMFVPCHLNSLARPIPSTTLNTISTRVGAPLMFSALLWEAVADQQKQNYKAKNPNRFTDVGLFKHCLYANYFGEVAFWWSGYLAGARAYQGPVEYVVAALGVAGITSIIAQETKRRLAGDDARYKDTPGWKERRATTPVLIPIIGKKN